MGIDSQFASDFSECIPRGSSRGVSAFVPVKRFKSSVLSVMVGGEVFEEETNIDFYGSSVEMVFLGMLWRHLKK